MYILRDVKFYIDIDDVLLNTSDTLKTIYYNCTGKYPPFCYNKRSEDKVFMGIIDKAEFMSIPNINQSIIDLIHKLDQYGIRYKFLTHRGYHENGRKNTEKLFRAINHNHLIDKVVYLDSSVCKMTYINKNDNGLWILIDDNPNHFKCPPKQFNNNLIIPYSISLEGTSGFYQELKERGYITNLVDKKTNFSNIVSYKQILCLSKLLVTKQKLNNK